MNGFAKSCAARPEPSSPMPSSITSMTRACPNIAANTAIFEPCLENATELRTIAWSTLANTVASTTTEGASPSDTENENRRCPQRSSSAAPVCVQIDCSPGRIHMISICTEDGDEPPTIECENAAMPRAPAMSAKSATSPSMSRRALPLASARATRAAHDGAWNTRSLAVAAGGRRAVALSELLDGPSEGPLETEP
eukprot:Amastigsp_a845057_11.p5 type:complete len:196 gc:universal Amastigsp_a845057_11:606-19(-)